MSLSDHEAKKATTDADSIVTSLDTSADVTSEELLEAVTELSQRVSELESTVEDQQGTIEQLRSDLRAEKEMRGKQVAETRQQVEEVRETVSVDETSTPEAGQTTVQPDDLTPVEQLARADDVEAVTDSASVRRAVTLFKNLEEWGRRAPKGITIKPSDNPLSLLEAACDESLCWKQWYRTAQTLERLSEGAVTFFDSDNHGKMICLHEQSEVHSRVTSETSLSPSTAATTS